MSSVSLTATFDRVRLACLADGLAIVVLIGAVAWASSLFLRAGVARSGRTSA